MVTAVGVLNLQAFTGFALDIPELTGQIRQMQSAGRQQLILPLVRGSERPCLAR
jgi:hypothetical protein